MRTCLRRGGVASRTASRAVPIGLPEAWAAMRGRCKPSQFAQQAFDAEPIREQVLRPSRA